MARGPSPAGAAAAAARQTAADASVSIRTRKPGRGGWTNLLRAFRTADYIETNSQK